MSQNNKQLLIVFGIGAALAILFPSFVNVPMVFIALAITLLIQRFSKKKQSPTK